MTTKPATEKWNPAYPPAQPWEPPFQDMLRRTTIAHRALHPLPPLRILVTGSRDFGEPPVLDAQLEKAWEQAVDEGRELEVIHGACPTGADAYADMWVVAQGLTPIRFFADWSAPCRPSCYPRHRRRRRDGTTCCPAAGYYRDRRMVLSGRYDKCLAFPAVGAANRGTTRTIGLAEKQDIPVEKYWGVMAVPRMAPRVYLPVETHPEPIDRRVISP